MSLICMSNSREKKKKTLFRLNRLFSEALRFLDICRDQRGHYVLKFGSRKLFTSELCEDSVSVVVKLQVL